MIKYRKAPVGKEGRWCYLPMAAWYAIVSEGKGPLPLNRIGDVGRLAALGSWRVTQGVYRFDQDLYEAVRGTPLEGEKKAHPQGRKALRISDCRLRIGD